MHYKRAIAIDPSLEKAWYDLGRTEERLNLPVEAMVCYARIAHSSPNRWSPNAVRVMTVYEERIALADDILPSGLLVYCGAPGVRRASLQRLIAF
jgi:hypothetical protein